MKKAVLLALGLVSVLGAKNYLQSETEFHVDPIPIQFQDEEAENDGPYIAYDVETQIGTVTLIWIVDRETGHFMYGYWPDPSLGLPCDYYGDFFLQADIDATWEDALEPARPRRRRWRWRRRDGNNDSGWSRRRGRGGMGHHAHHDDPECGMHEYDYHYVEFPDDYECPPIIETPPPPCLDNPECERPCHVEYVLTMGTCPHDGEPKYNPADFDHIYPFMAQP